MMKKICNMRNFFFLIFLVLFFSFCAGGNLKVKLNSDFSGTLTILEKKIKRKEGGHFFGSGLRPDSETELYVKERSYSFSNITQISPPGLRFIRYKEEGESSQYFIVVVDTSAKSELIKALGIKKEDILNLVNEAKVRDDLLRFNMLSEHLQIEMSFPFPIRSVGFTESRRPGDWTARLDGGGKVVINIPLHACFENEHPLTEILIQYKD